MNIHANARLTMVRREELVRRVAAGKTPRVVATALGDSIKAMTLNDAKGILSGPNDAATQYFRKTGGDKIAERFKPIAAKATIGAFLALALPFFSFFTGNFSIVPLALVSSARPVLAAPREHPAPFPGRGNALATPQGRPALRNARRGGMIEEACGGGIHVPPRNGLGPRAQKGPARRQGVGRERISGFTGRQKPREVRSNARMFRLIDAP